MKIKTFLTKVTFRKLKISFCNTNSNIILLVTLNTKHLLYF